MHAFRHIVPGTNVFRALAILALGSNAFLRLALGATWSICFRLKHGGYIF